MNYIYVVTVTSYSEGYEGVCYESTSVSCAFTNEDAAKTYCVENNKRSGGSWGSNYEYETVELK